MSIIIVSKFSFFLSFPYFGGVRIGIKEEAIPSLPTTPIFRNGKRPPSNQARVPVWPILQGCCPGGFDNKEHFKVSIKYNVPVVGLDLTWCG